MTKAQKAEREELLREMRGFIKPGNTIYTVLRHVSQSGMSRNISLYILDEDGRGNIYPRMLDGMAAKVLGYSLARNTEGVKVGGAGMDMGFHLVYALGRALYPDGFKLKEGQYGRNGDTSGFDKDGGYSLRHQWI